MPRLRRRASGYAVPVTAECPESSLKRCLSDRWRRTHGLGQTLPTVEDEAVLVGRGVDVALDRAERSTVEDETMLVCCGV